MSKGLATALVEAFEMVEDLPEGVEWPESPSAEALARMDWAAALTDDQMRVLRLAVELVNMTETVHKHDQDRQAFYWLRHGLEALP